jgi:hypothetical protein
MVVLATDWLDTFRDREDNVLIVGSEALIAENPWPEWQTAQDWYDLLRFGPVGERVNARSGNYGIQSTASGASLMDGGDECAWAHAVNGDQESPAGALWNTSTTSPSDHGPPVCRPIGEGAVAQGAFGMQYRLIYGPPNPFPGFVAGSVDARVRYNAWAPAFRYAHDELTERGALPLSLADPIADGVPPEFADSAVFEWGEGELELVSIEFSGDDQGNTIDPLDAITYFFNDAIAPDYIGPGTFSSWSKGTLGSASLQVPYAGGTHWNTLDDFTDWSTVADTGPDAIIAGAIDESLVSTLPSTWDSSSLASQTVLRTNPSRPGFRLTFRSPQYRWTWIDDSPEPVENATIPPRRIWPRNDGATQGSRRVLGGGNTRQAGSRTIGSIL